MRVPLEGVLRGRHMATLYSMFVIVKFNFMTCEKWHKSPEFTA